MRSVYPNSTGAISSRAPSFITDQKSPWNDRWGGWYVTNKPATPSMANDAIVEPAAGSDPAARTAPQLGPLAPTLDASAYLTPNSDQVALLVLAHQTQMHNLITLTNYQTRLALYALRQSSGGSPSAVAPTLESLPLATRAQIERPAEQLLRYMLFIDETPLGGLSGRQVIAGSPFARDFAARGLRDGKHRSLRDFDLHDRIFRYPCSYLIYSQAFDALPEPARGYVLHRLLQVLSGQDRSADFAGLSSVDRQAILTILLETKPDLPAEWRDHALTKQQRATHQRTADLRPKTQTNTAQPKEG